MLTVIIDSKYYRGQFDDWLGGGRAEHRGKTYHWSAQNSNYGFGWQIDPISEEDWSDIPDEEFDSIIAAIEKCLYEHRTEYVV